MSRRARGLVMLGLSAISAGLAVSLVEDYAHEVRAQVGPLVPVAIARREIARGRSLTPVNLATYVAERRIPERFVPPGSFRRASDALGLRALVRVPAGTYLSETQLSGAVRHPASAPATDTTGARVVEVPVAGATALGGVLRPGARVDVLVTSDRASGAARTYLALQRIELVDFRPSGEGASFSEGGGREPDAVAALRVTLPQAVLLTAAQNFDRELRLVARPAGDGRRLSATAVAASDLHP